VDRSEKIERIANKNPKIVKFNNMVVTSDVTHPAYTVKVIDEQIGETGDLRMFEVIADDPQLPCYSARWDAKDSCVDIDAQNCSREVRDDFKYGRNGYSGHHCAESQGANGRTFDVEIKSPLALIFKGKASFGLGHALTLQIGSMAIVGQPVATLFKRGSE
jgi:hypothetical protein